MVDTLKCMYNLNRPRYYLPVIVSRVAEVLIFVLNHSMTRIYTQREINYINLNFYII